MDKEEKQLAEYVNKASELAEALRKDIRRDGKISNKTVMALNEFIITANSFEDLEDEIVNLKLN